MNPSVQPEQHTVIDQRTRFTWPVVVVAVSLAFAVGAAHVRVSSVETAQSTAEVERKADVSTHHAHELRIQRLEDDYRHITGSLDRIERKLGEMGETRPAGSRRQ